MNQSNYKFSADISQLLSLIINTFYSNKDIFLRELISNSSDSLNKFKYENIKNLELKNNNENNEGIYLYMDKENKKLYIEDTGIGMTFDELKTNLGTIAKSGTKEFLSNLKKSSEQNLIGQFGVGFYSAFLVADKVKVYSKHMNEDDEYIWESDAKSEFTIIKNEHPSLKRGVRIELQLKDDENILKKYLNKEELKNIIQKHVEYINYPIYILSLEEEEVLEKEEEDLTQEKENEVLEKEEEEDLTQEKENEEDLVPAPELEEDLAPEEDLLVEKEDEEDFEEIKNILQLEDNKKLKSEKINNNVPLWVRANDEISENEYKEFYKNISNDFEDFSIKNHFKIEGNIDFTSILYLPSSAGFSMFETIDNKKYNNIKLYVKRVFAMDNCKELMPEWLQFVKGIVDSNDLPLNVSREMLQENNILKVIRKTLVKKSIEMLLELSKEDDKYMKFYDGFSKYLKLGLYEEEKHKENLISLLRFYTSKSKDKMRSFDECNEENIYIITGESKEYVDNSPYLETLKKRNIEVFYLVDAIDEYLLQKFSEYNNKKVINILKDDLDFLKEDSEEKNNLEELENSGENELNDLCDLIKETLKEKIETVKISNKLEKTPCVLLSSEHGLSANMQRILKAQTMKDQGLNEMYLNSKKIMEINPKHSIIRNLLKNKENKKIVNMIDMMYETSLLSSGYTLNNPSKLTEKIFDMIDNNLKL